MGPDALADWHTDTHFLFAAHNLPNEACHSPSPPFNSSLADCHFVRFMDVRRDKDPSHPPPIIIVIQMTIVGGCIGRNKVTFKLKISIVRGEERSQQQLRVVERIKMFFHHHHYYYCEYYYHYHYYYRYCYHHYYCC